MSSPSPRAARAAAPAKTAPSAFAARYLEGFRTCLTTCDPQEVAALIQAVDRAYAARRQIFVVGNGGSASTASHMASDLNKTPLNGRARPSKERFRVIALTDNVPVMTAWANDADYTRIFAEQLTNLAEAGDLMIVITGSGNSANIVEAVRTARTLGLQTWGLLGFDGGQVKALLDGSVLVVSRDYGFIENAHLVINHLVVEYFRERLA